MKRRDIMSIIGFIAAALAVWWLLFVAVPRWYSGDAEPGTAQVAPPATTADAQRKITATLYYVGDDGMSLVPAQREVPFGEPIVEQARHIVEAQLAAPAPSLVSAIPNGTTLRALYLSERGDVFVDLSGDVNTNHTGGSMDEILTVYTIVNTLTVNLPAVTRVQILIDGKEVDTLAGHVDLRNPLSQNLTWIKTDNPS
ncbi:GerMN domain-containing protein [soil metagenome]